MIIAMFVLAILIEIGLPFAIARWSVRRYGFGWRFFWAGALTFILAQVLHIPFLQWATGLFNSGALPSPSVEFMPWFNAIFLGLAAGVFEETARLVAFWLLRKRATGWGSAVTMGAGHGGIESIFVGLSVLANLVLVLVVTRLGPDALPLPAELVQTVQAGAAQFFALPWYAPLLGAAERISAVVLHILLSVLVWMSLTRRNALYFFAALLWHAVIDAVAVLWVSFGINLIWLEALLLALTVVHLGVLYLLRRNDRQREQRLAEANLDRVVADQV